MKNLIVLLSCYTGWEVFISFFVGVLFMIFVGLIVRAREKQILKEQRDLEKLIHAIQRYYALIKNGKASEAQKKALNKIISVFSHRVIDSSPLAVEYALRSFRYGVFDSLRNKISEVYHAYKYQFQQRSDFNAEEPIKLLVPIQQENIITSEDAIDCIQKAFEEAEVK